MADEKPGAKRSRELKSNGAPNGPTSSAPASKRRRWDRQPAAPPAPPAPIIDVAKIKAQAQKAALIREQLQSIKGLANTRKASSANTRTVNPSLGVAMGHRSSLPAPRTFTTSSVKIKGFSGTAKTMGQLRSWKPLRLDAKGREIDEKGNVIRRGREVTATLKVNLKRQQQEQEKLAPPPVKAKVQLKHLDPRISVKERRSISRRRKALNFVKQGKYQRKAQALRMQQISQQLREDRVARAGTKSEGLILPTRPVEVDELPDIEWWDEKVLGDNSTYNDFSAETVPPTVTLKVHHPVPLAPPCEEEPPGPMALMLTKKERKKIRRMNKLEKEREQKDLIAAGVIPPKEPRLKLSNMMKILMDEATADPSAVEAKVRAQMAKRAQAHLEHNNSRKLSKQAKADKLRKKLKEDTRIKSHITIYRAPDISNKKQIRYKISTNADQYNMTGVGVISNACTVVVLEGGPKGTKKFKGLMMRRIKWQNPDEVAAPDEEDEDDSDDEYDDEDTVKRKTAKLVWEGVQNRRRFLNFRFEVLRSESEARSFFAEKGLEHYWDQCMNDLLSKKDE